MTTEYMDNAQAVLDIIERNPEKHDQNSWGEKTECGTTACVAGHLALLHGDAKYMRYEIDSVEYRLELIESNSGTSDWQLYGAEKLGLDFDDATELFLWSNNDQAKEALKYLSKGEEIPWDDIYS